MTTPFQSLGSSSWADDDEIDVQPTYTKPTAKIQQVVIEEPREEEPQQQRNPRYNDEHDTGRGGARGRRNSGDYEKREKIPVPDHAPFKSYIGNLPYSITEDDLANFFRDCNIVDIRLPQDYQTGRPKGFAYIEFKDRESLVHALEADGHSINQRAIRVDVAGEKKGGRQDNAFFQKRDRDDRYQREDRYNRDDRRERNRDHDDRRAPRENTEHAEQAAPAERRKLSLLPRTKSKEEAENAARPANVFGDAKPRDERNVKPVARQQDAPKDRQREQGGRGAGGRGGRGDSKPSRSDGDWTRGTVEEKKPAPKARAAKAEKEPKAPVFKAAPTTTKTINAFSALGGDSDSD